MSGRDYCYPPDYTVLRNRLDNGRTQLQYLKQLAACAGHAIDLTRIDPAAWLDASRRSNAGDHAGITSCIRQSLV